MTHETETNAERSYPRRERPMAHQSRDDRAARARLPRDRRRDPGRGPRDRGPATDQRGEGVSALPDVPPRWPADQGRYDVVARGARVRDDAASLERRRPGPRTGSARGEPAVDAVSR